MLEDFSCSTVIAQSLGQIPLKRNPVFSYVRDQQQVTKCVRRHSFKTTVRIYLTYIMYLNADCMQMSTSRKGAGVAGGGTHVKRWQPR